MHRPPRYARPLTGLLGALALVGPLAACSDDAATAAAEDRVIGELDAPGVPPALNGLSVNREDIADQLEDARRPYLDEAALFSLRTGEELQATLQIGRFADGVDVADEDFRDRIVSAIGAGGARQLRVADHDVYLTAGDRQQLAFWFTDQHLYVLSTRDEFLAGRALLRTALGIEVAG